MFRSIVSSFFLCALSFQVNAAPLDSLMTSRSDKSPYQVLEEFYYSAQRAATVNDFDLLGSPSNMKCAEANQNSTSPPNFIERFRVVEVAVGGSEGRGPLFPEVPPKVKRFVFKMWSNDRGEVSLESYHSLAAVTTVEERESDLLISIPVNPSSRYWSESSFPNYLSLRASGNMTAYQYIAGTSISYGYCWRE